MGYTIKDVSKVAGVSIASVSRHINKSGNVSSKTAKKIKDAIEALNFRPNIIGRSLRTGKTNLIGIMIPTLSNPVFADAMTGIQEVAKAHGYTIIITNTEYNYLDEEKAIDALLANGVDGLILTVSSEENNKLLNKLDQEKIPYVLLYNNTNKQNRSIVSIDNYKAAKDVAKSFIDFGHKNFAMISISNNLSDRAMLRQKAFINHLKENDFNKIKLIDVDSTYSNLEEKLQEIYTKQDYPTAIFCSNDSIALNVISLLKKFNIKVPANVSVIGFDGIKIAELLEPKLSTVLQPSKEMGRVAFSLLLKLIKNEVNSKIIYLPYELRLTGTTGFYK